MLNVPIKIKNIFNIFYLFYNVMFSSEKKKQALENNENLSSYLTPVLCFEVSRSMTSMGIALFPHYMYVNFIAVDIFLRLYFCYSDNVIDITMTSVQNNTG